MAFNPPARVTACVEPDSTTVTMSWVNAMGALGTQIRVSPPGTIGTASGSPMGVYGLTAGGTYTICLRHRYRNGNSAWVCVTITVPTPQKPERPTITVTPQECGVDVKVDPGGATFVRTYAIYRKCDGEDGWKLWRGPLAGDTVTCTGFTRKVPAKINDPDPACRVCCYYAVAVNKVGSSSGDAACGSSPTDGARMPVVTLTAAAGPCVIELNWSAGELPCGLTWSYWVVFQDGVALVKPERLPGISRKLGITHYDIGVDHTFQVVGHVRSDCEQASNVATAAADPCVGHPDPNDGDPL